MNNSREAIDQLQEVAKLVMADSGMPDLPNLISEFSEIERRRDKLICKMRATTRLMDQPIDGMQYQLLMDYTLLQAAKKNIDSDFIFMEICVKYGLNAPQDLTIRDFWDALTFVRTYLEAF